MVLVVLCYFMTFFCSSHFISFCGYISLSFFDFCPNLFALCYYCSLDVNCFALCFLIAKTPGVQWCLFAYTCMFPWISM